MRYLTASILFTALASLHCTGPEAREPASIRAAEASQSEALHQQSRPSDPDLELNKSCPGHPKAAALKERIPSYVKELVVLWPRVGRSQVAGSCQTVIRLTAINHQGVLVTISVQLHGEDQRPQVRDFHQLPDASPPQAAMDLLPDPELPYVRIALSGSASTSREAFEGILDYLNPEALVETLLGDRAAR